MKGQLPLLPLFFLLTVGATPAAADATLWCNQFADPARQIKGCTEFIRKSKLPGENVAVAYTNRGIAYASRGQVTRALADFNEAIRIAPESPFPYYNRGNLNYDRQQYRLAVADFDAAIERQNEFALAYFNRGLAYEKLGEKEKGIEDFQKALELDPGSQAAKNGLNRLGVSQ